jgi:hypothetical protein
MTRKHLSAWPLWLYALTWLVAAGCDSARINETNPAAKDYAAMPREQALAEIRQDYAKLEAARLADLNKTLTPLEREWGIKLIGVTRSAAGYMLDFRYTVLDAEKATPLLQRKLAKNPMLVSERTGAQLGVPFTDKAGSMRSSVRTANQIKTGRNYRMLFANPGGHVKAGDLVSIVIGKFKVEHLKVL